jgi:hypothetical protein
MIAFHAVFPEVANEETRTMIVPPPEPGTADGLPADEYGMAEFYCDEVGCDCRRTMIQVYSRHRRRLEAVISHAFDWPEGRPQWELEMGQTFLDPINPQGEFAERILDLFIGIVLSPEYEARLRRHYAMVKRAIANPSDPAHARVAEIDAVRRRPPARRGNPADLLVPRKRRKWR